MKLKDKKRIEENSDLLFPDSVIIEPHDGIVIPETDVVGVLNELKEDLKKDNILRDALVGGAASGISFWGITKLIGSFRNNTEIDEIDD